MGNRVFDSMENMLSVIKIAAILMFLIVAGAALMGWIPGGGGKSPAFPLTAGAFFLPVTSGYGRGLFLRFTLSEGSK
ncbi:hypothetical protein HMSSN036_86970 [Paenibacillus macerans]|nr:hypothetical protein HMSSN036_86970 [Paenibacillus macerans]